MSEVEAKLINASKLIRQFEISKANTNPLDYNTKATYAECIARVKAAEAIEAEPVRHGQWVEKQGWNMGKWRRWLECSKCGYQDYYFDIYEDMPFTSLGNYCPNCGAKMDGGKQNGTSD